MFRRPSAKRKLHLDAQVPINCNTAARSHQDARRSNSNVDTTKVFKATLLVAIGADTSRAQEAARTTGERPATEDARSACYLDPLFARRLRAEPIHDSIECEVRKVAGRGA